MVPGNEDALMYQGLSVPSKPAGRVVAGYTVLRPLRVVIQVRMKAESSLLRVSSQKLWKCVIKRPIGWRNSGLKIVPGVPHSSVSVELMVEWNELMTSISSSGCLLSQNPKSVT